MKIPLMRVMLSNIIFFSQAHWRRNEGIMKQRGKWNYLQILLAIVIAFSGICTYSSDTYSLFCHTSDSAPNTITQALDATQLQPDVCGTEQLNSFNMRSMLKQIAQKSQSRIRSIRQRSHSRCVLSLLTGAFLPGSFQRNDQEIWMHEGCSIMCSARLIIEYIHHQDGSKG